MFHIAICPNERLSFLAQEEYLGVFIYPDQTKSGQPVWSQWCRQSEVTKMLASINILVKDAKVPAFTFFGELNQGQITTFTKVFCRLRLLEAENSCF